MLPDLPARVHHPPGGMTTTRSIEAWALLDVTTGHWTTACTDCTEDLHPTFLPISRGRAARRNGQPVLLVPQRVGEQLRRGDNCDLCLRAGRHRTWDGTRWVGEPHPHPAWLERFDLKPATVRAAEPVATPAL